jgi:acyl-CoA synthetase (NDP forming)
MPEHPLDPLLNPGSIALVGASDRPDSPGQVLARMVIESDYTGEVYPVNPGYPEILGQTCSSHSAINISRARCRLPSIMAPGQ